MNKLTEFLVNSLLEVEVPGVTALFGGGFKPPTKGHLEVVLQALKDNPEIDQVYIYVGSGSRNNISQAESIKIWEMYQRFIPVKSEIIESGSPIADIKDYLKDHEGEETYILIGARSGNEEDEEDYNKRSSLFTKYGGTPKKITTSGGVSGTKARAAAKSSREEFYNYIPDALTDDEKNEIYKMILSVVNENASYSKDIDIKGKIDQLTQHMIDKGMNIEPLPALEFVDGDSENARDFFGKTAYYEPNTQTIVLYTEGRHPKDIVRSYAHEMIHHIQNLEGRLGNITTTNTQEDDYLNDIEAEANLKGTMTFRNWTDSLNEVGDASQKPYRWNRRISEDPDDGLIEGVDYRFTTDLNTNYVAFFQMVGPMEYEFGFNIPGGNQAQTSNKGELFRVMATMVAIIKDFMDLMGNDWSEISFSGSKDPSRFDDNRRDKLYMAYIKKNLPSSVEVGYDSDYDMTVLRNTLEEGFNKKLGKDPFGLEQFARELVMEGAYDALTTKLTKATINKWVEDSKKKPMPKKSFIDIDIDEVDGKGREIEFNYVGMVEFDKKVDGYEVNGTSNSGEDKGKMKFIATLFKINPKVLPQAWSKISADVSDVIRHEIEHLTQAGDNTRSGKYMEDDMILRNMINKAKTLPQSDYYKLEKEVDAMLQGLYLKAKKTKKPFKDVLSNYLDNAPGVDTKEDKKIILNLWRSRRGALSLPVFETEKQVMQEGMEDLYTIYLDMDGVIVDFDRQFEEAFGMPPREFEEAFGTQKFWEKIEERGVGFWRGMKWMPGGEELYRRVSQHDHYLLSSPSRSDSSKIGKHMWKKDKTPNTKLILSRSYNKKNYADKSNILIDDRESNIQQWRDAGGIGILYKSAEQVNKELDKLGL